jgi:ketosteroid isomerase-like protein
MKFFLIPALSLVALGGVVNADQKATESEIRHAIAAWVEANNRGDDAMANQIWAPDVDGWFPKADDFKRAAAFPGVDAAALKGARSTFSVEIREVLASTDLAVVRDVWRETLHSPSDQRAASRTIWSYEVWKPQPNGKWKITRWISAPERWELTK